MEKINILIGEKTAFKGFKDFYDASISLSKSGLLRRAIRNNLILETDEYSIRFVPNTRIEILDGLKCYWAYGFSPETTQYLEFRTSDELKRTKPLVENTQELIERIAKQGRGADG